MKTKNLLFSVLVLSGLSFSAVAQLPYYIPTGGLVGYWPLDGNAKDESGNGNHGTIIKASLATDRFGRGSTCYYFDGSVNNYIKGSASNFPTAERTISLWFYSTNIGVGDAGRSLIGYGGGVCGTSCIMVIDNSGSPGGQNSFEMQSLCNNNVTDYYYGNSHPNSAWHHWAATTSNEGTKFYLDGALVKSSSAFLNNTNVADKDFIFGGTAGPQGFGPYSDTKITPWQGSLDEIGIWSRVLTADEILNLYKGNLCYELITVTDTLKINFGITAYRPMIYKSAIKIYPNPTRDHIYIDNGDLSLLNGYQIKISNLLGQQVFQSQINQQQFYLELTSWRGDGIYFVNLINPAGVTVETRKIVLQ